MGKESCCKCYWREKGASNGFRTRASVLLSFHLMAGRIISWGGNGHIVSPNLLKTPSIVSVDSILRDTSPAVQGTPHAAQSRAMNMASQVIEPSRTRTRTSTSTYPAADAADGSFVRHPKYFFNDGNVAFLVRVVRLSKWCDAESID